MIAYILYGLLLVAGIPTGFILSKLCKEELKLWKKRFVMISLIALILIILLSFIRFEIKIPIILSLIFIIITNLTIICKSIKNNVREIFIY